MNSKLLKFAGLLFFILIITGGLNTLKAQMFSVRSPEHRYTPPGVALYAYFQPTNFHYKPSGVGLPPASTYNFNNPIYGLEYESGYLSFHLGLGWNLGPGYYLNYFSLGGKLHTDLPLVYTRLIDFGIPVVVNINNLRVQNKQQTSATDTFNQNSATIGTGLELGLVDERHGLRFKTEFVVGYGFSSRAFGVNSGTLFNVESNTRLYFDRIAGKIGFSIGFSYQYNRFNLPGVTYDYTLSGSRLLLGVTF